MKIEILNNGDLTCFKGTATLVEEKELEKFDNYIHEIAEEQCKMTFKEKEQILTQRLIKKQEEEIKRLNNIINRLGKELLLKTNFIEKQILLFLKVDNGKYNDLYKEYYEISKEYEDKLKELKEGKE